MCLDLKDLNRAITHEHHKTPILEELIYSLSGSTTYSELDAEKKWFLKYLLYTWKFITQYIQYTKEDANLNVCPVV